MWELIESNRGLFSDRLGVPGGWIVRSIIPSGNTGASVHMIFVNDPSHEWKIPVCPPRKL